MLYGVRCSVGLAIPRCAVLRQDGSIRPIKVGSTNSYESSRYIYTICNRHIYVYIYVYLDLLIYSCSCLFTYAYIDMSV